VTISKAEREYQEGLKTEARAYLIRVLPRGGEVYTCVRRVSRSGMQRSISLHAIVDGRLENISLCAGWAIGWRLDRKLHTQAIVVDGCGMDMCFHTVYVLAQALFPRVPGERDPGYLLTARDL